jgi:hypothetical protein
LHIQRSIKLENRANRQTNDKIVGSQLDKKNSSKLQDRGSMSEEQKLRKWVGVGQAGRVAKAAFVATLAFTGMSGAMADQFQKQQCNGSLSEGGFNNLSPEATQYNALRERGMKDEQILEVLQQDQPIKQKHEERQFAKKALENSDDHLDGLSKLFEEIPGKESSETNHKKFGEGTKQLTSDEKIATARAVAEEASKIADRVTQVLAARRLLLEQKSIAEAPAEAPQTSAEAPQKSYETEQKDVGEPCLLSGPPPFNPPTTVTIGEMTDEEVLINYNLHTINSCKGTISNMEFKNTILYGCPAGCAEGSGTYQNEFLAYPRSIGLGDWSSSETTLGLSCKTNSGDDVPPTSATVIVQPAGTNNGQEVLGQVSTFTIL